MKYAGQWAQRLMDEKAFHDKAAFVTLTYNDESLPKGKTLVKRDVQNFLKRLRKERKVRYYCAGEYGEVGQRPHYHLILFGVGLNESDVAAVCRAWTLDGKSLGFVDVKKVEYGCCAYVARYVVKKQRGKKGKLDYSKRGVAPEFCLMSRGGRGGEGGIGLAHVKKYKDEIFNRGFAVVCGHKAPIPRYYVKKVYDTEDRLLRRREQVAGFVSKELERIVDKRVSMGYTSNMDVLKAEAEGTEKMLKGKLALRRKVL